MFKVYRPYTLSHILEVEGFYFLFGGFLLSEFQSVLTRFKPGNNAKT